MSTKHYSTAYAPTSKRVLHVDREDTRSGWVSGAAGVNLDDPVQIPG